MKKIPLLLILIATFVLIGARCYYLDESDRTDEAFAFALWGIIPFAIIIDVAFIGLISRFITWVKNFKK